MNGFIGGLLAALKWIAIVLGAVLALLVVAVVVLPPLTRGFTDRWGATDDEVAATYPGDDLVEAPQQDSTRAVYVDAPPALVFALLKQMGYARGGWYGWDWFYKSTGSADFVDGHHSQRIDPDLQGLTLGDSIELFPGAALEAVVFEPGEAVVFYKITDEKNRLLDRSAAKPAVFSDMSWAWIVVPEGDGCRLVLRTRASAQGMGGFVDWLYDRPLELGGAVMGYKTLRGIKRTAEQLHAAGVVVNAEGTQVAGPVTDRGRPER